MLIRQIRRVKDLVVLTDKRVDRIRYHHDSSGLSQLLMTLQLLGRESLFRYFDPDRPFRLGRLLKSSYPHSG
jgi:hypothetical protein